MPGEKKYGLIFKKHIEQAEINLKDHTPVLKLFKQIDAGDPGDDYNYLIEGENLYSLKLLEKTHKNAIDVIYIDPPYNTLNEDFVYGDKMIDEEDGFKHSKWLSFMDERLQLAKKLLSKEGIVFISIDEYEFAQLKLLCDSVFGEHNFVENFIWSKNSTKNLSRTTSTNHEYILCYANDIDTVSADADMFRIAKTGLKEVQEILKKATAEALTPREAEERLKSFYKSHPELKGISNYTKVDYGSKDMAQTYLRAYRLSDISAPKAVGTGAIYEVLHPLDGKPCKYPASGWRFTRDTMDEHIRNGRIEFYADHTHVPQFKRYLDDVETEVQKSIIQDYKDGKKELNAIFGVSPFENPKPTTLIKTLLRCCHKNAVVLDFFAGSGTTAQAVLELNQEDGGNRHFILCTNNEVSSSRHLDYLHDCGYMVNVKASGKNKTTQSKIDKFFRENPEVYQELMIDEQTEYEKYGICQSVTYPRLATVITGIRQDGSKYSDGIPCNLKYLRVELSEDAIAFGEAE